MFWDLSCVHILKKCMRVNQLPFCDKLSPPALQQTLKPSSIGLTADPSKEYCCLGWKLGMNGSNYELERHIVEGLSKESSQDPLKNQ